MHIRVIIVVACIFAAALSIVDTPAQTKVKFEQPILITSAGQSADVTMASILCKKGQLTARLESKSVTKDLESIKTLIIVPGYSSKGLGAAGISREEELKRTQSIIAEAKKRNIKILMLHLGGNARRGQQSDDFNKLAAEAASHLIVVKQGDEDQFFSNIAARRKIAVHLVEKMADASGPLQELFK
ncbi:MAG: hypothetical protein FJ215_11860 [Ignavibacteria bacterium]|nr:hypothetical protein [Ignavibacteria bacterium]